MVLMLLGMCWLLAVLLIVCVCLTASEGGSRHDPPTGAQLGEPVSLAGMVTISCPPYEPHTAPAGYARADRLLR
jgi:hypothetical protein